MSPGSAAACIQRIPCPRDHYLPPSYVHITCLNPTYLPTFRPLHPPPWCQRPHDSPTGYVRYTAAGSPATRPAPRLRLHPQLGLQAVQCSHVDATQYTISPWETTPRRQPCHFSYPAALQLMFATQPEGQWRVLPTDAGTAMVRLCNLTHEPINVCQWEVGVPPARASATHRSLHGACGLRVHRRDARPAPALPPGTSHHPLRRPIHRFNSADGPSHARVLVPACATASVLESDSQPRTNPNPREDPDPGSGLVFAAAPGDGDAPHQDFRRLSRRVCRSSSMPGPPSASATAGAAWGFSATRVPGAVASCEHRHDIAGLSGCPDVLVARSWGRMDALAATSRGGVDALAARSWGRVESLMRGSGGPADPWRAMRVLQPASAARRARGCSGPDCWQVGRRPAAGVPHTDRKAGGRAVTPKVVP